MPDNRVLIFLNAFEKPEATHLLVLGYLVASVFFYHNSQPLAEDSNLTKMLAFLKQLLEGTQVHQLYCISYIDRNKSNTKADSPKSHTSCVYSTTNSQRRKTIITTISDNSTSIKRTKILSINR